MEILKDRYTITELSEQLKVTDHALRYYEREFKIKVPKDERGRRTYTSELANIMFQIKNMRDQGFEIKAIKKILETQHIIDEPPPVIIESESVSIVHAKPNTSLSEMKEYFEDFKNQITASISEEADSTREQISREIYKTKLELGACVENSVRKLESKMEKHFEEVDRSITVWREKNKQSAIKRLFNRVIK